MGKRGASNATGKANKKSRDAVATPSDGMSPNCASHLVKVHEALNTIRNNPLFSHVASAMPLKIGDGGLQAPFSQSDCTKATATTVAVDNFINNPIYKCGGNLLWVDHTWLVNHRVPFNASEIKKIQAFHYPPADPPATAPHTVRVAIDDPDFKVTDHVGSLQRVSPEELCHALLFSIEQAINMGCSDDILRRWSKVLLSYSFEFQVCPEGDDRFWLGQGLREVLVEQGESVKRTVSQRVWDVGGFKLDKERSLNASFGAEKVYNFNMIEVLHRTVIMYLKM